MIIILLGRIGFLVFLLCVVPIALWHFKKSKSAIMSRFLGIVATLSCAYVLSLGDLSCPCNLDLVTDRSHLCEEFICTLYSLEI